MDIKEALSRDDNHLKRHPWEIARLKIIHELYGNAFQGLSNRRYPSVTLDVGCGDLFMINSLAANYINHKFIGVDRAINSQTGKTITDTAVFPNIRIYSSLDPIKHYDRLIDIVLLCDVLEHIEDDVSFLNNLSSNIMMKPDAVFIITVPAFQNLFYSHDNFLDHFRRYNHLQLLKMAHQAGLNVVDYGYFFSSLLLPRFFQVIFERIFSIKLNKNDTGLSKWKGYDAIDSKIVRLLLLDYYFSKRMRKWGLHIWGLSCFMICQKQALF
jgi:hypothetical protein